MAVGRLDLATTVVTVIAGGIGSVMLIYSFGKRYGREFFVRKNYRYFSTADIIKVESKFERWGALILIFSRFVVGFRSALALVAGISRYDSLKMMLFSTISYMLFGGLLMYAAIKLVENLDLLAEYFRAYNLIVWPVLIIILALFIIRKFRTLREKTK